MARLGPGGLEADRRIDERARIRRERQDGHRPSVIEPAEYVWVGAMDTHEEEGFFEFDWRRFAELTGQGASVAERDYRESDGIPWAYVEHAGPNSGGRGCDHCGQTNIRHWAFYLHVPTLEVVKVGGQCAAVLGAGSRAEVAQRQTFERRRRAEQVAQWREAKPEHEQVYAELMRAQDEAGGTGSAGNEFMDSLYRQLVRKGELSDAQVAAVLKGMAKREQRREREDEEPELKPVPKFEGRAKISGRILTLKWQESDFGGSLKMLVLDDRAFKVWGTCPDSVTSAIEQTWRDALDAGEEWAETVQGQTKDRGLYRPIIEAQPVHVEFMAAIERSQKDETFAFFKRPTKVTTRIGEAS